MSLPEHRRIIHGRTFSSPWDRANAGRSGYRPPPTRRLAEISRGIVAATIVCTLLWVILNALKASP